MKRNHDRKQIEAAASVQPIQIQLPTRSTAKTDSNPEEYCWSWEIPEDPKNKRLYEKQR